VKIFSYEGVDSGKNRYRGTIKARTSKLAVGELANRGLAVSWIEEMTGSQIAVANRLRNMKKFADNLGGEPTPKPSPSLSSQPQTKPARDWMYWIFITIAIIVVIAALSVASSGVPLR
jgi:hypothetical protein